MRKMKHVQAICLATAAVGTASLLAPPARAATRYWVGLNTGNWSVAANWSSSFGGGGGFSPPVTGDFAGFYHTDSINRTASLDISADVAYLQISNAGTGNTLFQQNIASTLGVGQETLGFGTSGEAVHSQSNGLYINNNILEIGLDAASIGTYNLSGSGVLKAQASGGLVNIGINGTGIFNQSGGTFIVADPNSPSTTLTLGVGSGSSGTYNLSGGALTSNGQEFIGFNNGGVGSAVGSFVQTGGTHTAQVISMGYHAGSVGVYNLSGAGVLNTTYTESIGYYNGSATFTQTGGTNTAGSLEMAGSGGVGFNTKAVYNLSGTGLLAVTGSEKLGLTAGGTAAATFNQTGGTHTVGAELNIGNSPGTSGVYNLSGGRLTARIENVGVDGAGTFIHTGGTNVVTDTLNVVTFPTATGTYNLSGTGVINATKETIGGAFVQTGGTNIVGTAGGALLFNQFVLSGTSASYSLSGGTLTVNGLERLDTKTTFTQTGGTHTVGQPGEHTIMVVGHLGAGVATYNLSAGTLTVNGQLGMGIAEVFGQVEGGTGSAVLNISGGSATVTDQLFVFDSTGTAVNLSAGTLSVHTFKGSGNHFNWTGGTLVSTDPAGLPIGPSRFFTSMTLGAGKTLNAQALTIDTGGVLTLSGGMLAYNSLNLAGGTINGTSALNNSMTITGYGTIAGTAGFANSGGVTVSGGPLVLSATGALTNSGTIALSAGNPLQLTGSNFINTGAIALGGGTISGSATLNNNAGGVISGSGTISSGFTNSTGGTLLLQGGTLNGSIIINMGVIRGDGLIMNQVANPVGGEIRGELGKWLTINTLNGLNNGKINLQGGTVEFNNTVTNPASGLITGRGTLRANANLLNSGQIQLVSDFSEVFGNVTNNSGGKIIVSSGANATFYNAVTANAGSEFRVSAGSLAVFFGNVTGTSNFTGSGLKDFQGGSSSLIGMINTPGSTAVEGGASLTAGAIREESLTIDHAQVTITPDGTSAGTSHLTMLSISSGKFDLRNNKLIVTSADVGSWNGSSYSGMTGLIASGRNGSTLPLWDGNGLLTTQTFATAGNFHTLAISTAAQAGRSAFGGLAVTGSDVLVMYTYGGDANLDGKLNIDDYIRIDSGIASSLTGYSNGDFNYDGKINIDDYTTVIDANIGNQSGVFPAADSVAAVPEPVGVLGLAGVFALGVFPRRRRRIG